MFLQRDADIPRYQLDAKYKDWFWRVTVSKFNTVDADDINFNLSRDDESYSEELQKLDSYSRDVYVVTLSTLKI